MAIDTPSLAYDRMIPKWDLPNTLWGGTSAMVDAGRKYLPQHAREHPDDYRIRLNTTVVQNFYRQAVKTLGGIPFKSLPSLGDDVDPLIVEYFENIDLEGTHWHVYSQEWLIKGIHQGIAYTLVDFPSIRSGLTLAEENSLGARPYAVMLGGPEVISVEHDLINGEIQITRARILQTITRQTDEFVEELVEQIRIIERDQWFLHEKVTGENGQVQWVLIDEGRNTLGVVPLVPFYTEREGRFEAEPPLLNLAEMNKEWWELRSNQKNANKHFSFPILFMKNILTDSDVGTVPVGPNSSIHSNDPAAEVRYVGGGGENLASGAEEIDKLERNMRAFSHQFEVKDGPASTATGRMIDKEESLSALQRWTINLNDSMEQVLDMFALWSQIEEGGSIKFDIDFSPPSAEQAHLATLMQLRMNGDLSKNGLMAELKRRNIIVEDLDLDEDEELIEEEDAGLGLEEGFGLDGNEQ